MAQSGPGLIRLFNDFFTGITNGATVADTGTEQAIGDFRLFGTGSDEADAGAFSLAAEGGAVRLTTTNEDNHATFIGTNLAFTPNVSGMLVAEARVQLNNLDTKEVFFGFTDLGAVTLGIEGVIGHGATTTLTLTASDICGFLLSAELTDDEAWHFIHNGGSAAGVTVSTTNASGVDAVAGEWDVLRIEIDVNGTARWYINGVLEKTLVGAVAPTVQLGVACGVEAKGANVEEMDLDYLLVEATRDWTR